MISMPFYFSESILRGKNRCVLVSSMLLNHDCGGNLIQLTFFKVPGAIGEYRCGISKYDLSGLQDKLRQRSIRNVNTITDEFERHQWAFYPARRSSTCKRGLRVGSVCHSAHV